MRVRALSERVWGKGAELAAGARVKGKPGAGRLERGGRTRRRGAGWGTEGSAGGYVADGGSAERGRPRGSNFLCSSFPLFPRLLPARPPSVHVRAGSRGRTEPGGVLWGGTAPSGAKPYGRSAPPPRPLHHSRGQLASVI